MFCAQYDGEKLNMLLDTNDMGCLSYYRRKCYVKIDLNDFSEKKLESRCVEEGNVHKQCIAK